MKVLHQPPEAMRWMQHRIRHVKGMSAAPALVPSEIQPLKILQLQKSFLPSCIGRVCNTDVQRHQVTRLGVSHSLAFGVVCRTHHPGWSMAGVKRVRLFNLQYGPHNCKMNVMRFSRPYLGIHAVPMTYLDTPSLCSLYQSRHFDAFYPHVNNLPHQTEF